MFSPAELSRYHRHLILSEIGESGQRKLKSASVLVVGAGGLGCPVLQYLTAAGVGKIGIVDYDVVDESNLQRQVLFNVEDVGQSKSETAARKLILQNPFLEFVVYKKKLDKENALDIIREYDIVVDGSDNFPTRYLSNDACVMLGKPLVSGAIFKFEGQVSVFNLKDKNGNPGPTYRCLFPEPPAPDEVPNCSEIGVLGVLPGMIGAMQANEVIKIITGIGEPLSGKLLLFDALSMQSSVLKFSLNEKNLQIDALADYEDLCTTQEDPARVFLSGFKEITVLQLKELLDKGEEVNLLDVREPHEREICSLGGIAIRMNDVHGNLSGIPREQPVVVYCHHGMRSAIIVKSLSEDFGFKNLYNLKGGIHAWARDVDNEMARY